MSDKIGKNIVVTGGAGFIGFHLSKRLLELGHKVTIIDNLSDYYNTKLKNDRLAEITENPNITIHEIDISKPQELNDIFKNNNFDLVYHIAAQPGVRYSFENPEVYLTTNIEGTNNILELMVKYKIKNIIFASSSSVYGNSDKESFSEDDNTSNPVSLYAVTKLTCESLLKYYHHQYNLNVIAFRFFTVYGPWGRPDMAPFLFTEKISKGKEIDVYNNGKHQRDFTYIDDIIEGNIKALDVIKDGMFEIINLGNSKSIELEYFISVIEKELNQTAKKNYLPMQPGDVVKTSADISKAKELLNWQPTTSIEVGMNKFINWYKDYFKI
ncbi:NAD-dependent epimerase/dehydratase family protein [bacterium]|jgi:UDP-glucuronate 4-epimerase|nr:NAD-dependent epimerase/dehydratase family protein [bacterium]MBT4122003.1 NAD-dependent epimerase/dehydratase family protein [bacterium]MBT4335446.1 NAD-dependent epimerase/dehydratase family protein [bacterium]MBT4495513.1 NAD-dependent epimerase/dehydratase family protein [bacterium]MBT4764171.1 NAD-dependent epimerase/dehydratase family protein [bacterium]